MRLSCMKVVSDKSDSEREYTEKEGTDIDGIDRRSTVEVYRSFATLCPLKKNSVHNINCSVLYFIITSPNDANINNHISLSSCCLYIIHDPHY
uniref:Ovule protein n=1 Tax=Heterorhabditis bacteriophora TaxID=37862 RepID=A0A1I7WSE0_HETBA